MPNRRRSIQHEQQMINKDFFTSSTTLNDTRIVDFSSSTDGGELYEPGSRFESPESSPATPSFTFTSFEHNSSSSTSEHYTIYPTTRVLPTILPIPFPPSSSSPSPPKLPAYSSKSPPGLRVDASPSPTSPSSSSSRSLLPYPTSSSPTSRLNSLLLRTIPHKLLPNSITSTCPPNLSFEYPKSPSLLRAHPTQRHSKPSSADTRWIRGLSLLLPKRWIVLISFFLIIVVLSLVGVSTTGSSNSSTTTTTIETGMRKTSSSFDWVDRVRGWETWRKLENHYYRGNFSTKEEEAEEGEVVQVNYLESLESVRTSDGGAGSHFEQEEEEETLRRKDHHSSPSTVVSKEEEEEQAVLNAVVEEAKKVQQAEEEEEEEEVVIVPAAAAAKETIQKVVKPKNPVAEKEVSTSTTMTTKPKKDPSRYKRLLPLKAPSRRYLYGANFVPSSSDASTVKAIDGAVVPAEVEVEDPEYTNKKVKVPSKKTLERLFKENKKVYEQEEQSWRQFEWKAPEVDQSLKRFIAKLSPEELSLRSWIQQLYSLPSASGVGLGSSSSNSFNPSTSSLTSLSSSLLPTIPGYSGLGNREKYDELISQAREGFEGKCRGGKWLDSYGKMHREMLEGKRDPKFISYHCEKGMNCGGLGDRLLGMTSAFFFGLITQRSFLGEWQSPIPLDVVFDSPAVNWSHSSFTSSRHPVLGQQTLIDQAAELDIIHFDRLSVDSTFGSTSWNPKRGKSWTKGFEKRDIAYASNWIKFFTNRGMIYRSFSYKHLQKSIDKLGLKPTTAFACINQYLFRPKPPALNLISEYTSVLSLPSVFSVGIHVRTGDRSMKDTEYDKINTVKRHSQFFRCARELGETYASPSQQIVYYLVTDSANLKADAQRTLGTKLVTTNMVPQHVHQKTGHVDGVFSAVVEDWILSKTDMMVATQDSGFGKLASFMHGRENTTVTIFPRFNEDVNGLIGKKSHLKVDCTDPNVFTSFEELSSEWSLG
ncbi:hypothetical protein JCM5350_002927 [Sporobolomyces pararoseus]